MNRPGCPIQAICREAQRESNQEEAAERCGLHRTIRLRRRSLLTGNVTSMVLPITLADVGPEE